jgi:putative DNA-invertase from lambdoid prophage Rac
MMHGITVDRTFVERGVSGAKPIGQRPEGSRLLGILQPGDVVIAAKLERLFRSVLDALEVHAQFIKRGIDLHLIDLAATSPTACRSCSTRSCIC